jgi:hypothetical protein
MKTLQRSSGREIAFSQRSECHGVNSLTSQLYSQDGSRFSDVHLVQLFHYGDLHVQGWLHSKSRVYGERERETICGWWPSDFAICYAIEIDVP